MKLHISKMARNTTLCIVILLLLFLGGGVVYTYIMDQQGVKNVPVLATPVSTNAEPSIKAAQPAANAKEGASVETVTTPVSAGNNASITVQTNPGSTCTIAVVYNNVASTDSGLGRKLADAYGTVSWTWTVEKSVPLGTWPVTVTCVYHSNSGVVQANVEITK